MNNSFKLRDGAIRGRVSTPAGRYNFFLRGSYEVSVLGAEVVEDMEG